MRVAAILRFAQQVLLESRGPFACCFPQAPDFGACLGCGS